jgi:hypothetical protein
LLLALQVVLTSCSGDNLVLPSSGEPAKISVRGDGQTGTVGQELSQPIVIVVTDPANRPVEGVEVVLVPPAGAQISPNDTVETNSDGEATIEYTLSPKSGNQIVEVRATPVTPSVSLNTTFTIEARPEAAVGLVLAGSRSQQGQVSTALPESLAVRAVDQFGNGVEGVEVTWEAEGGSVSASRVTTGSDGRAAVQRILGDRPGSYPTTAAAGSLNGSPIAFTAIAVAAPQPELVMVTQPSPQASAGVPFPQQPELQLQDPFGAPLNREDVRVTAAIADGTGSLAGRTTARSDATGRVRFENLSIEGEPGPRTLIFAAEGFSSVTSSSISVAPGPPSPDQSSAAVPVTGTAGEATSITIRILDEFGTGIEGSPGLISVSVSGANQASNLPVTEEGNGAYITSYTPARTGRDEVDVRVNGESVDDSPFTIDISPGPASPVTTTAEVSRTGFIFTRVDIVVTTRDAQGNLVGEGGDLVEVQLNGENLGSLGDNGDGTYSGSFATFGPVDNVGITLNGQPIAGSPFHP